MVPEQATVTNGGIANLQPRRNLLVLKLTATGKDIISTLGEIYWFRNCPPTNQLVMPISNQGEIAGSETCARRQAVCAYLRSRRNLLVPNPGVDVFRQLIISNQG